MTVVEALRARTLTLSAVTAIASTRIHALAFPQSGLWPASRLFQVGAAEFMHLVGSSRVHRARIQFDHVADADGEEDPYTTAHALARAVHGDGAGANATGLCGWKGEIGSPAFIITGILPDGGPRDFFEESGDQRLVRVQQDYLTWFID